MLVLSPPIILNLHEVRDRHPDTRAGPSRTRAHVFDMLRRLKELLETIWPSTIVVDNALQRLVSASHSALTELAWTPSCAHALATAIALRRRPRGGAAKLGPGRNHQHLRNTVIVPEQMNTNTPIIAIELILVFGGALLFGWWQLRSIKRNQQKTAQQKLLDAATERSRANDTPQSKPSE